MQRGGTRRPHIPQRPGPLSERRNAGAPRALTSRDSTAITRGERMRPSTSIACSATIVALQLLPEQILPRVSFWLGGCCRCSPRLPILVAPGDTIGGRCTRWLRRYCLFTVLVMLAGARFYRQVCPFIRAHLPRVSESFGLSLRRAPA